VNNTLISFFRGSDLIFIIFTSNRQFNDGEKITNF
jgi:hypothetical protein